MDLLGKVQRNSDYVTSLYGLIQKQWGYGFGGTVVTEKGSPFDLLGKIQRNSDYITSLDSRATVANDLLGKIQRNSDFITSLDSRVSIVNDLLGKVQRNSDFITSLDSRVSIVNDLLGKIQRNSDFITSLDSRLERYYPAHSQLVSKGFSDVLDGLGSLSVSWSESDKGALFAKLDGISDRLSVEAGQTILDALLGEVKPQYINDQLTIVKEVARNRFPFCIPAMMQQMLGLMQSEAQVPHWEFDFFGSPLVLDLGDLEGFALVTRWASCFMLFLALLANTKRFIFDLGGGGR